jgi:hypothetical protein
MSRIADRVYSDAADLARFEALALQLPQDARVAIVLDDGCVVQGIVTTTPTLQMFFDPQHNEGLNGVVRIEGFPTGSGDHSLWLDRIQSVTSLPNPSPPEASSRIHPPDPNAPTQE